MSRALVPMETIADDICADISDSTSRFKFSIMRKLMAGWRELNLYVDPSFCVQTAILSLDNVIQLPSNCVYITKVGIKRNGIIAMMSLDSDIQKQSLTQEQTEQQLNCIWNGDFCGDQYTFYNCNGGLGEYYGYGGNVNLNGYYNIDIGKGEIYIGSLMPDDAEFVVEFKSDGSSDGLILVPIQYWNCLKYYGLSEWYAGKNLGLAEYNRTAYEREYNKNQRLVNYRSALFMANEAQSLYKSSPR